MPIEDIFHVPMAAKEENVIESKKTWRDDAPRTSAPQASVITAGEIMESRALDRGYCKHKSYKG